MDLTEINKRHQVIKNNSSYIRDELKGKKVRVVSNFNNQPHGRSRGSWKGRESTIRAVIVDEDEIFVALEEARVYMPIDEVKFVGD